jgi:DNA-binding response OmpR family regulator
MIENAFRRASSAVKSVLVVEPDPRLRELIRRVLEEANLPAETPANGDEALTLLQQARLGVVLFDADQLMDGIDMAGEVRAGIYRPALVCLSTTRTPAARAAQLGAVTCLGKPFDIEELPRAVRAAVRAAA